jgi:flagellar protein FliL
MADEEIEVEGKKKSPLIKIIVIALVAILVLVGTVVGTLFVTGFFDKKDTVAAEEALKNLESGAANNKAGANPADAAPQKVAKESPELKRFENSYMELEKPLVSNLTNTRKVIQLNLAIMTHYDERVFKNAKKTRVRTALSGLGCHASNDRSRLGQARISQRSGGQNPRRDERRSSEVRRLRRH